VPTAAPPTRSRTERTAGTGELTAPDDTLSLSPGRPRQARLPATIAAELGELPPVSAAAAGRFVPGMAGWLAIIRSGRMHALRTTASAAGP
jgi:hypothetical protein